MSINLDQSIFYLINKCCSNRFFDVAMPLVSSLGSWEVLAVIAVALFFFKSKQVRKFGFLLFLGLAASYGIVSLLKIWIARPRPFLILPEAHLLVKETGFSFPSGHAANIFMVAILLCGYWKKPLWVYLIAIGVAFSRVYLGVHFLSDVAAGALIGALLGKGLIGLGKVWPSSP